MQMLMQMITLKIACLCADDNLGCPDADIQMITLTMLKTINYKTNEISKSATSVT